MTPKQGRSSRLRKSPDEKIKHGKVRKPITENTQPNSIGWFDYQCIFTLEMKPMNHEGIERLASEIIEWAVNDPEAFKVSQFHFSKGIGQRTWNKWLDAFPILKEAQENACGIIGNRREIGAIKKKLEAGIVASSMHHYDPEWKASAEWRASLRDKQNELNSGPQIIVIEKIPTSNLVPEKKNEHQDTEQ